MPTSLPFGKARVVRAGKELTRHHLGRDGRALRAGGARSAASMREILDLRTLSPWDRAAALASVEKTRRCLIVHEDNLTAGFGAEIAAVLAQEAFFDLDAPIERLAMPDIPSPHSPDAARGRGAERAAHRRGACERIVRA